MKEPGAKTASGARRGLQALLLVMAAVMIVAGLGTVVLGAASVPGEDLIEPATDSEMRFYAVWYAVSGFFLLRSVREPEAHSTTIRLVAAGFFSAGCARVLSWAAVGRPVPFQILLMWVELILPLVVVPWQALVSKARRR